MVLWAAGKSSLPNPDISFFLMLWMSFVDIYFLGIPAFFFHSTFKVLHSLTHKYNSARSMLYFSFARTSTLRYRDTLVRSLNAFCAFSSAEWLPHPACLHPAPPIPDFHSTEADVVHGDDPAQIQFIQSRIVLRERVISSASESPNIYSLTDVFLCLHACISWLYFHPILLFLVLFLTVSSTY